MSWTASPTEYAPNHCASSNPIVVPTAAAQQPSAGLSTRCDDSVIATRRYPFFGHIRYWNHRLLATQLPSTFQQTGVRQLRNRVFFRRNPASFPEFSGRCAADELGEGEPPFPSSFPLSSPETRNPEHQFPGAPAAHRNPTWSALPLGLLQWRQATRRKNQL